MDNRELRKYIAKRVKQLDKEWNIEAEKDDRKKAADYLAIGSIQGKIDALLEIQTMLTKVKV